MTGIGLRFSFWLWHLKIRETIRWCIYKIWILMLQTSKRPGSRKGFANLYLLAESTKRFVILYGKSSRFDKTILFQTVSLVCLEDRFFYSHSFFYANCFYVLGLLQHIYLHSNKFLDKYCVTKIIMIYADKSISPFPFILSWFLIELKAHVAKNKRNLVGIFFVYFEKQGLS